MKKNFFEEVASANKDVAVKDVKRVFIWYDLLGYLLPFQLIFIITHAINTKLYPVTVFSVIFVSVVDTIIWNSLERDKTNFEKFNKNISLIKLWSIPLIAMAAFTIVAMYIVSFNLI